MADEIAMLHLNANLKNAFMVRNQENQGDYQMCIRKQKETF